MKGFNWKRVRNVTLLVFPILLMVGVNEFVRVSDSKPFKIIGYEDSRSFNVNSERCTWYCYSNTSYCKKNHVKFLNDHFETTDPIYYGIINLLNAKGTKKSYVFMNLVFLVLGLPILYWGLIIKIIDLHTQQRK